MSQNSTLIKKPVPILYVNYHGTIGGGQIHLLTLLEEIDRAQFIPYIVCCEEGVFTDALRERGIQPIIIPFPKPKFRYFYIVLPAMWKLYHILKSLGIKLVQVSGLEEAKLAVYPCHWAKIPVVWLVAP